MMSSRRKWRLRFRVRQKDQKRRNLKTTTPHNPQPNPKKNNSTHNNPKRMKPQKKTPKTQKSKKKRRRRNKKKSNRNLQGSRPSLVRRICSHS
jgi:hypothetical protein